jgi:PQQ-like domain
MNTKKLIAMLLLLTFAASLVMSLPTTQAQAPAWKTFAFVDAVPNPVGVGQEVLIRLGVVQLLGYPQDSWTGLTVTVVKPDGTTETLGPFTTDSTGGTATLYTPTAAGTYKLTTHFPQQAFPETFFDMEKGILVTAGTVVQSADSDTIYLVVQQAPLPSYPGHALPTEYWTRPIDPQLREWYTISGNWVNRPANDVALYNDNAPETAHVLWTKPLTTGGLTGGLLGEGQVPAGSETGDAYAGKFLNSVVLNGVLYYNRDDDYAGQKGIVAVDLHTGQELWFRNNTYLSFGQVFYFNSYNYDGVYTYLWDASAGSTWKAYDPFTGEWTYTMINMPSGTQVYGPSGEILIYQIDYANGRMALWNSTAAGHTAPGFNIDPTTGGSWSNFWGGPLVSGSTIDASDPRCYTWNVSIPAGLAPDATESEGLQIYADRIVALHFNDTRVRCWAISNLASNRGTLLFDKTWNAPSTWLDAAMVLQYTGATDEVKNGVIAVWAKELRKHYAFSVETGDFLWETASEHWLDWYGWGNMEHTWYFAYGKLYSVGVAGIVYAYDLKTGNTAWTYNLTDAYNEPVTGNYWWGWITMIADGKVYVGHLEHSAEQPIPRGAPLVCLNGSDGSVVWRVNGMYRATRWGGNAVMGDSIMATMDTYDQRIWAVGKGPSATTVTVQDDTVTDGDKVLLKGYVTDTSPGTKDVGLQARFPNGVPAVSDDSQSDWMLHVYKQFELPTSAKGVEVIVEVFDPNNNYYEVGRATTDLTGFFKLAFTPQVPGEYTIVARFAGSKAYYGSFAENAVSVKEAPPATPVPTNPPASLADQYLLPATGGIIAAIAIVGAIVVLMLRRK